MKNYLLIVLFFTVLLLPSCSSEVTKDNSQLNADSANVVMRSKFPAALPINKSNVKAMIESIYVKDKSDFFIKARILSAKSNPGFPSYAVSGASYILMPDFKKDKNDKLINSQGNTDLTLLTQFKSGETFNAIIYYEQFKGWLIEKIIK